MIEVTLNLLNTLSRLGYPVDQHFEPLFVSSNDFDPCSVVAMKFNDEVYIQNNSNRNIYIGTQHMDDHTILTKGLTLYPCTSIIFNKRCLLKIVGRPR